MTNPNYIPSKDIAAGRSSLHHLDLDDSIYIVEGTFVQTYDVPNPNLVRFALEDVLVRKYDKEVLWEDSPVVAMAGHINCIRKAHNAIFTRVEQGQRLQLLGTVREYGSNNSRANGVDRRTLKSVSDSNIPKLLSDVCNRIQSLATNTEDVQTEEVYNQRKNDEKQWE